jgi:hypothetical protein
LESTNVVQYYDGAAWATVGPAAPAAAGALTFISGASLSGNSQTFSSAFSATYDSYLITLLGVLSTASTPTIRIRLGSSTTLTYNVNYSTPGNAQSVNSYGTNANIIDLANINSTQEFNMIMAVGGPFLSQNTIMFSEMTQATQFFNLQCNDQSTTSFTAFTLSLSGANTFAAGSVKIYGYANS